ncbi:MAG: polysaccharide biosynthesis/export family protein [Qingshengfaniella sp.]
MQLLTGGLKLALAGALSLGLSACQGMIPRTGPSKGEIFDSSVQRAGDTYVVTVNDSIARAAEYTPTLAFSPGFRNAPVLNADTIRAGDTLGMMVWENVPEGLLGIGGSPAPLERIQVDSTGDIFVPYVGRIRAAGKTPDQLRNEISETLGTQTPDPQVMVTRIAGDGATVSVSGMVGAQGVYPIERSTRTLSAMLARAGGLTIEPEIAKVTVLRGTTSGTIWFDSLYATPANDIALREGDRVLVENDERYYVALGATGRQARIRFESQELSAIEALAQVGGLSTTTADPTGIFLLREENQDIARRITGQPDLTGPQKIAYVFNLTEGKGLFAARTFTIRDEDTLYVTEAPISQFNKAISAILGTSITTVASVQTVSNPN